MLTSDLTKRTMKRKMFTVKNVVMKRLIFLIFRIKVCLKI